MIIVCLVISAAYLGGILPKNASRGLVLNVV